MNIYHNCSASGAQIISNPWVWYSHYILPMKNDKLKQINMGPRQQVWVIGRCSLDSQHGGPNRHLANVGCSSSRHTNNSSFRYTNNEQIDHSHQIPLRRIWTRENKKLALYCYLRSKPCKKRV